MIGLNGFASILRDAYEADRLGKKRKRSERLIRPPSQDARGNLFACLPPAFNSALDIAQIIQVRKKMRVLVWTQGAVFNFQAGHTIYDTPSGYAPWGEALQEIRICFSIQESTPVEYSDHGAIQKRNPGTVVFKVSAPNVQRDRLENRGLVELTQDAFLLLLIAGPLPAPIESCPYLADARRVLKLQTNKLLLLS